MMTLTITDLFAVFSCAFTAYLSAAYLFSRYLKYQADKTTNSMLGSLNRIMAELDEDSEAIIHVKYKDEETRTERSEGESSPDEEPPIDSNIH